jgi:hypothetical protein
MSARIWSASESARRSVVTSSATMGPVSSTPQSGQRNGCAGNAATQIGHLDESKKRDHRRIFAPRPPPEGHLARVCSVDPRRSVRRGNYSGDEVPPE